MDITPPSTEFGALKTLYRISGADMNSTADQAFVKMHGYAAYCLLNFYVINGSTSLTTAVGGIYTAASKAGTPVVAASQAYSTITGATTGLVLTISAAGRGRRIEDLILSLTTPQGAPATVDIYAMGFGVS